MSCLCRESNLSSSAISQSPVAIPTVLFREEHSYEAFCYSVSSCFSDPNVFHIILWCAAKNNIFYEWFMFVSKSHMVRNVGLLAEAVRFSLDTKHKESIIIAGRGFLVIAPV
jgi:hypothetical protein